MKLAYFDCCNGASGDMIVGALLDAGVSFEHLQSQLKTLPLGRWDCSAEKIKKQGFVCTQFRVETDEGHPHRHLQQILQIIDQGKISATVAQQSRKIFQRLAEAEASVHGTPISQVHFHEVGAIDAIVDIVGTCIALESLDVGLIHCSPIPTGSGTVRCEHGLLPVPAPGTAALLKNIPLASSEEKGELTTPTGAAILSTLASTFGPMPSMKLQEIGYGAGQREGQTRPNLMRVLIGEADILSNQDEIVILQTNIDDQNPEIIGYTLELLLEQGALDAFCQPIYMKKGRLGMLLTVLCEHDRTDLLESLLFSETTTFGIRRQTMKRSKLERRWESVELSQGTVRMKIGFRDGLIQTVAPEFEDCKQLAIQSGHSVKEIMNQAIQNWQKR